MNIGGIQQNTSTQNTGGSSAASQAQQTQQSANASVRDLPVGETFSGRVINREGDVIQVRLNDDSVLEAKLAKDMQLQPGQMVSFSVKASGQDGVSLMPLFTNTAEMSTASKALMSAGLGQTGKNLQMVSDMMREGMPIGRDSLLFINKQLAANPTASVTDIVQMNRMGIPVTEANLEQFANYKAYEHQINAATDHIFSLVPETFEDMLSQGLAEEAVQLYQDILSLVTGEDTVFSVTQNAAVLLEKAEQMQMDPELVDLLKDVFSGQDGEAAVAALQDALKGDLPAEQEQLIRDALSLADQLQNGQGKGILQAEETAAEKTETDKPVAETKAESRPEMPKAPQENSTKTDQLMNLLKSVSDSEQGAHARAEVQGSERQAQEIREMHPTFQNAGLTQEEVVTLIDRLKQAGAPEEMTEALAKGELPAREVLKFVKQSDAPRDDMISLLKNTGFQKLAKSELSAQWKITPEQAFSKTEVEELYRKINEQTRQLMNSLHTAAKGDSPLAGAVTNLQNNMDFMNQLNHMFPYIQLPLKMSGSEAHGDLYVYTNRKNLAKDDGSVSALLHLDMDHLGPMNVFVKMTQGNHVNTNFYMADEAALDLVAAHMDELTDRLVKRGYQVDVKYALNEENINVMEEMIKQDRNITTVSSTTFDARA